LQIKFYCCGSGFGFFNKRERAPSGSPLSFVEKYVVNLRPTQMLSGFEQGD